ncbi:serine/threonine protein kinase [Streptomyces sp. NPDC050161]|uniref:serine/threonine protein kinase n=1 Tax=Streptomyces sp. NPDC050161 TaxID=3365604 RepID=UPI0037A24EA7
MPGFHLFDQVGRRARCGWAGSKAGWLGMRNTARCGTSGAEGESVQPLTNDDPRHVGPFRIIGLLGTGGMGRVYLGRTPDGSAVAVKTTRRELADDRSFRKRFAREVAAAQRVSGPFAAPVVDAAPHADVPWMATEYVPGLPLGSAVDRYGSLPEDTVELLASGLLQALSAIHAQNLVHRDLKPSNIILTAAGPRVIDFGIARSAVDTTLTTAGTSLGTPGFMAPEQLTTTGPELTGAADVFAFGGVLVFAATGSGPFGTAHPQVLMYRTVHDEPWLEALPDGLARTTAACLDKAPGRRPTIAALTKRFGPPHYDDWLPGPLTSELRRLSTQLNDPGAVPTLRTGTDRPAPDVVETAETHPLTGSQESLTAATPVAGRKGSALSRSTRETSDPAPEPHGPVRSPRSPARPAARRPSRRRLLTALSATAVAAGGGTLARVLWPVSEQGGGDAKKPAPTYTGEPAFELPLGSRKIDAVMPVPGDDSHPNTPSKYWLFAGDHYLRVRISSSKHPVLENLTGPSSRVQWTHTLGLAQFKAGIDAVMRVPGTLNQYWVFSQNQYIRMEVADSPPYGDTLTAGPFPISDWAHAFRGLPPDHIDAVMPVPKTPNLVWVFSDGQYVRTELNGDGKPGGTVQRGPVETKLWTFGSPQRFNGRIDAAMPLPGKPDQYWVFSGTQYMKIQVTNYQYADKVLQEPEQLRTQPAPESSA